jgi:hypothetical protein
MTPAAYSVFLRALLEEESIVYFNPPTAIAAADGSTLITWANRRALTAQKAIPEYSVAEYVSDLVENNYSCILPNAGLLQIEYKVKNEELLYHRYCYVPAPFDLGEATIGPEDLDYLADTVSGLDSSTIRLHTKLRFEYDVNQQAQNHPKSHLHLHFSECRIPVKSSIGVHSFFRFIYKHFCTSHFLSSAVLPTRRSDNGYDSLSDDERSDEHISWAVT